MLLHGAAILVLLALVQLAVCAEDYYKARHLEELTRHSELTDL